MITYSGSCDGEVLTDAAGARLGSCDERSFGLPTTTSASVTLSRRERTTSTSGPLTYTALFDNGDECPSNGHVGILLMDSQALLD